jgi:type II secretory pathway pseudopilin PulG
LTFRISGIMLAPMEPRPARAGVTLVEAALVVCVAGVVLAVFVPTFIRELRTSKIGEASNQLAALHQASAAYYGTRHQTEEGPRRTRCLPLAAGPTPAETSVDPVVVDFTDEELPGRETFEGLGWAPQRGLRYRYSFSPVKDGCDLLPQDDRALLTLRAEGDLDGDGKLSLFERQASANDEGELVPIGVLRVQNRTE